MQNSLDKKCLIVGASHAGAACAQKLRRQGWQGTITLVGDEPHMPYHRPPLSKDYLKGIKGGNEILLSSAASYEKSQIELIRGVHIESIDRDRHRVLTADDTHLGYDKLVLATGARARELPFAKRNFPGVCYLRNINDVDRIRDIAPEGGSAVIIGGGYIGLEAAATLRTLGLQVTVLEAMDRVLERVTSEPVSSFLTRIHREEGVDIRTGCQVAGIVGKESVQAVQLESGEQIKTDLVIIGIGVIPNTELATTAGLKVDNGICVDEFARTDDPDIYAVGDCANFVHRRYQRQMRLESVQNANDQALTAAKSIVGEPIPYDALPWFWSDQFDVKLQIAGLAQGYDEYVIRGEPATGRTMAVFYLQDKKLLAVDALNSPRDFLHGKKLIIGDTLLDTGMLADPEVAILDAVAASS